MKEKKPWIAFVSSFLLPGAGLAYLGQWRWAIANFLIVHSIVVIAFFAFDSETVLSSIHYLILLLAAGSGGIAHARAEQAVASRLSE